MAQYMPFQPVLDAFGGILKIVGTGPSTANQHAPHFADDIAGQLDTVKNSKLHFSPDRARFCSRAPPIQAAQVRPGGGVRVGHSASLIGQIVGTGAKGHVPAVQRVAQRLETGRFDTVERGGYSAPRDSRYLFVDPVLRRCSPFRPAPLPDATPSPQALLPPAAAMAFTTAPSLLAPPTPLSNVPPTSPRVAVDAATQTVDGHADADSASSAGEAAEPLPPLSPPHRPPRPCGRER